MQVEEKNIEELIEDPENSRKHNRRNLEAIKKSLEAFGQQKPIVIDSENKVIAGNGTLSAAREIGWKKIQTVTTSLKGLEQLAYAIADNRTADLASWDDDQLVMSLARIENDESIESAITGFSLEEIEALSIPDFQPVSSDEQSDLDKMQTKICPACGHEF